MNYRKFYNDKYFILTDQVLTSLMNFGSVLVLSSLLNENIFSKFVVLFSYSTLANTILTTIFSAPILVFGIKKWNAEKFNYLGANIIYFTLFNILFSITFFFFLRIQVSEVFLLNFLLMNFGMTLVDIFKRFIFSNKAISPIYAPLSSILMNIIFFGGILIFRHTLSLNIILVVYWVSYLISSFLFAILIYFLTDIKKQLSIDKNFCNTVFVSHFKYAKWVLAGAVSFWVYTQGIYIFGKAIGVSDFAISKLRVIQNLFGVFTILLIAMDNYFTPVFSKKAIESEELIPVVMKGVYQRYTKHLIILYLISLPVIFIVYNIIYQDKYGAAMLYIFIVWLTQLIAVSTKPISIALKAKEITSPLFYSHLFAAVSMIVFGSVLIIFFNDLGFILTLLLSFIIANIMNYIYFNRVFINR